MKLNKTQSKPARLKSPRFPDVIVRAQPAVFLRRPVIFSKTEPTRFDLNESEFIVNHAGPALTVNGKVRARAMKALCDGLGKQMMQWGLRCCVVLAPDSCVYLEFGILKKRSSQPPNGGLVLDRLTLNRGPEQILH